MIGNDDHDEVMGGLVKIQFYDPAIGYENLWAQPLGEGRYRLANIPFFVYDITKHDIVGATHNERGELSFLAVLERSGSRTLRARSEELIGRPVIRSEIVACLKEMGCAVEIHRDRLLAIDLPPVVNLQKVADYLTSMQLSWEYGSPSHLNT
jgi:hypothetical protein